MPERGGEQNMRNFPKLTEEQKKILDKAMDENKDIISFDELPNEVQETLTKINDWESLWIAVDRYIAERRIKEAHAKPNR
jgi:hypothetical protein